MAATLLLIAGAYLIGSVSFAVVVSRVFGLPDPHGYGSGNPGATNVLRTGHRGAALLTLLGDGGKGFVAVFAARHLAPLLGASNLAVAAAALAVFLGPSIRCFTDLPAARACRRRPVSCLHCTGHSVSH